MPPSKAHLKAQKEARARQAKAIRLLKELFAYDPAVAMFPQKFTGRWTPVRMRAGVPPIRTPEQKERHIRRKRARAARRLNRR